MKEWFIKLIKEKDKQEHIIANDITVVVLGMALFLVGVGVVLSIMTAMFVSLILWIGKEWLYDDLLGKGTPDVRDVYADVIGVLLGGVTLVILFSIWRLL